MNIANILTSTQPRLQGLLSLFFSFKMASDDLEKEREGPGDEVCEYQMSDLKVTFLVTNAYKMDDSKSVGTYP